MSGLEERTIIPEFTCRKCETVNKFWYVVGYSFNGWRRYGIFRTEGEAVYRHNGIRLSVLASREGEREGDLSFYQAPWWVWQLECPACGKIHAGNFRVHKAVRHIIAELEPEQFKAQILGDVL